MGMLAGNLSGINTFLRLFSNGSSAPGSQPNPGTLGVSIINSVPSYDAVVSALLVAASATDFLEFLNPTGSGKVMRVNRVTLNGGATSAGLLTAFLIRRSSASTGGTSTNPTVVKRDTSDAASSATIKAFTANPTPGVLVGNIAAVALNLLAIATGKVVSNLGYNLDGSSPIVLRPGESVCLNAGGVTVAGLSVDVGISWTEDVA